MSKWLDLAEEILERGDDWPDNVQMPRENQLLRAGVFALLSIARSLEWLAALDGFEEEQK